MDSEKQSQTYWEQVPHSELLDYASPEKTDGELKAITPFLKTSDHILDLGCGWGRMTVTLAKNGYHVAGVDLSENLIAFARQQTAASGLTIRFDVGSMLAIPHPDASFDKIICLWGVFNHLLTISDQVKSLNEMHRVLKLGGAAFIEMGNGERKKYMQIRETVCYGPDKRIWNSQFKANQPPNVLYIHDRTTLRKIAQQSQFERFRVQFKNINHNRRTVTYLFKS